MSVRKPIEKVWATLWFAYVVSALTATHSISYNIVLCDERKWTLQLPTASLKNVFRLTRQQFARYVIRPHSCFFFFVTWRFSLFRHSHTPTRVKSAVFWNCSVGGLLQIMWTVGIPWIDRLAKKFTPKHDVACNICVGAVLATVSVHVITICLLPYGWREIYDSRATSAEYDWRRLFKIKNAPCESDTFQMHALLHLS